MDAADWLIGLSRRLRLAALALLMALGVKTVAMALTPEMPPSASVQIETGSVDDDENMTILTPEGSTLRPS